MQDYKQNSQAAPRREKEHQLDLAVLTGSLVITNPGNLKVIAAAVVS